MVARIPYPSTVPKYYAVASEVATMDYLRSSGLPVPRVYGYSPVSDNAAKTAFIIMELMKGTKLSDVWLELGESEIVSLLRQFTQLESQMMSISFPAGGSLYYAHDLEKVAKRAAIPFKDERFCVGPDTRPFMWYGRRSQLDVERGPCTLLLFLSFFLSLELTNNYRRKRQCSASKSSPQGTGVFGAIRSTAIAVSTHKERGLRLPGAVAVGPYRKSQSLSHCVITHPQGPSLWSFPHPPSRPPTEQYFGLEVARLWLASRRLARLATHLDPTPISPHRCDQTSQSLMSPPSLPENFGELNESKQIHAKVLYRRHLVHHHYVKNTAEYNELLYAVLTDPVSMLLRRLFCLAGDPWEGETLELKVALIKATEEWDKFTGGGAPPCPVIFDAEDIRKTMELEAVQREADKTFQAIQAMVGFESESWVLTTRYDEAMVYGKQLKEKVLARVTSVKERAEIMAHWILDDIDETNYM